VAQLIDMARAPTVICRLPSFILAAPLLPPTYITVDSASLVSLAMPFKILIVGGGLSGLSLANGLLKHGSNLDIEISIYERDAKDANREGIKFIIKLTKDMKLELEKMV
jgi:pyruvate/2-oxoglutarate dehydrogenase complex dihydrolipoamide dehydrogenase (E3) component